jgi:hypothetical protein
MMNRRVLQIVIGFVLLIAVTAGLLLRVRSNYVLGEPGLKLVNVPMYNEETNIVSEISAYLPEVVGEYKSSRVEAVSTIEQTMLPPDTVYGRRIYTAADRFQALISVVVMGTDRTSIHKPQYCLTGQGQEIVSSELITIPITKPEAYELKAMKLTTRAERRDAEGNVMPVSGVFIYWFVADGELTPHHGERMWLMGKELLTTGLLQRWAYVAYFANCAPGQENELTERLRGFIAASVPEFQTTSGAARQSAGISGSEQLAQN